MLSANSINMSSAILVRFYHNNRVRKLSCKVVLCVFPALVNTGKLVFSVVMQVQTLKWVLIGIKMYYFGLIFSEVFILMFCLVWTLEWPHYLEPMCTVCSIKYVISKLWGRRFCSVDLSRLAVTMNGSKPSGEMRPVLLPPPQPPTNTNTHTQFEFAPGRNLEL